MTDRQTTDDRRQTDRQTDKLNPSVPYDTFACFAGLIIRNLPLSIFYSYFYLQNALHVTFYSYSM